MVKNPPAMWEIWVPSLGWEDPLEKRKATHSSILAWRVPWTVQSMCSQSRTRLSDFQFHFFFGSNITADGDCSHEIKRRLIHRIKRKVITNLDSILKSRAIPLPKKALLVKAMFFSISYVWM